jgi:hypothetical protein
MEKEFLPYTLALELKELGFDEKCYGYFTRDEEFFYFDVDDLSSAYTKNMDNLVVNSVNGLECTAPLYQQAFRWFREKHWLYPSIISHDVDNHIFTIVGEENYESDDEQDNFNTYEEAELACLKKLIEIVKK